jgi:hypothetical protein
MLGLVPFALTASCLLVAGCVSVGRGGGNFPSDATARPATDVPSRFDVGAAGATPPTDGACHSPITDPRSGAQFRFVRADAGRGDYAVSTGQYGARAGELLRVDCRTWQAIGLVRR